MLITMSIGIEGGYNIPAVGFEDIHSGAAFSVSADRSMGIVDLTFSMQAAFYTGDNAGYSMNTTGFRLGFYRKSWSVSPVFAVGGDYINRGLNQTSENGFAVAYTLGVLINLKYERLHIYPKFHYDGLTDMSVHAGFIGLKLGIGYEI
jgi:hypothetical protein